MGAMTNADYGQWLSELKKRIYSRQIKAAIKVNTELLRLYWDLGHDIVLRQMESSWGSGFFEQLSRDLRSEFPGIQGFSVTNLKYCKQFYSFYTDETNRQQLVDGFHTTESSNILNHQQTVDDFGESIIFEIPWGHHIQIFAKAKSISEALFYVRKTIENGWSRAVLMNFIETDLFSAQGKAQTNFSRLLPEPQSDLASQILKDTYNFDFLMLAETYKEKELEDALTENITKFLLELGQGFAYVGRQVPIKIGKKERFIDLLFYHLELRCFVVIELKAGNFEAEHLGKLGLYVSAVNYQMKKAADNATIGLIICKTKDYVEVQYSLESSNQPVGVSEYQLAKLLPEDLKSSLPSIEELEVELMKMDLLGVKLKKHGRLS